MTRQLTVGLCPDFLEERWPSMDRVAGQLVAAFDQGGGAVHVEVIRPPFQARAMRWSDRRLAYSIDRACNRFLDYPRHLRRVAGAHDVYHVVDHSYAHLAWHLPRGRTVVTCHDLDAFRSIMPPRDERRPAWFRAASRHLLGGLRRAAAVACDTAAIGRELIDSGIVPAERVFVVPLGVGEAFGCAPDPEADRHVAQMLPPPEVPIVLHVGSNAARKRVDALLRMVAAVRDVEPAPHLVRAGEPFTPADLALARELGLAGRLTVLAGLEDRHLAALYRRAGVLALPSDREGFGLPVIEALRCGTPVVASDLAVLREVGGRAARYCPAGDLGAWVAAVTDAIRTSASREDRAARASWASAFTWQRYAEQMTRVYAAVAAGWSTQPSCVRAPA